MEVNEIKRRVMTAVILMLVFSPLSLLAAYNLDRIASGHISECSWNLLTAAAGLENQKITTFFLLFLSLSALLIFCMAFGRSYIKYKSDMQKITPTIQTPKAEGQGQYGSAHWLEKERIPEVFTVVRVNQNDPFLRQLTTQGSLDLSDDKE